MGVNILWSVIGSLELSAVAALSQIPVHIGLSYVWQNNVELVQIDYSNGLK